MTYALSIRLALLVLFAGIVPLQAGSLKNPGFEEHGGWQVVIVTDKDKASAALLGASVSVALMLQVIQDCLPQVIEDSKSADTLRKYFQPATWT